MYNKGLLFYLLPGLSSGLSYQRRGGKKMIRFDRRHLGMALTSVITCHPVSSLEIGDFSPNEVGEDPDPFVAGATC